MDTINLYFKNLFDIKKSFIDNLFQITQSLSWEIRILPYKIHLLHIHLFDIYEHLTLNTINHVKMKAVIFSA